MKKIILIALALVSLSAAAQRRDVDGSVVLRDGRRILRIDVGDDRDDRDQTRRIHRLERAVRDLQDQVYQLQAAPVRSTYVVCSGNYFSAGSLTARANTETEARASLMQQCNRRASHIFCEADDGDVRCERGVE